MRSDSNPKRPACHFRESPGYRPRNREQGVRAFCIQPLPRHPRPKREPVFEMPGFQTESDVSPHPSTIQRRPAGLRAPKIRHGCQMRGPVVDMPLKNRADHRIQLGFRIKGRQQSLQTGTFPNAMIQGLAHHEVDLEKAPPQLSAHRPNAVNAPFSSSSSNPNRYPPNH